MPHTNNTTMNTEDTSSLLNNTLPPEMVFGEAQIISISLYTPLFLISSILNLRVLRKLLQTKRRNGLSRLNQLLMHLVLADLSVSIGPNHLVQRTSCRISIVRLLDSTGRLVGFYRTSSRILKVCFKCLRIDNFTEKCNKHFYQTSSKISIGHSLQCTRIYWTSSRITLLDVPQSRRFGGQSLGEFLKYFSFFLFFLSFFLLVSFPPLYLDQTFSKTFILAQFGWLSPAWLCLDFVLLFLVEFLAPTWRVSVQSLLDMFLKDTLIF